MKIRNVFLKLVRCRNKIFFVMIILTTVLLFSDHDVILRERFLGKIQSELSIKNIDYEHVEVISDYYGMRKNWNTSNLGSVLYKNTDRATFHEKVDLNRTYVVLIWKYWNWLRNRHVFSFGNKKSVTDSNALIGCSVTNCMFTGNNNYIHTADAVVVHLQKGFIPNASRTERNTAQRWIFLTDESPRNTFSMSKQPVHYADLKNIFNWSMTFRHDADVPVPYGRTVPLDKPHFTTNWTYHDLTSLIPHWSNKKRDVTVAILMSNCMSQRLKLIDELEKFVNVDVYGKCSKNFKDRCPGHFKSDCDLISQYVFYLALENSNCNEYITEKVFYNAYSKGAIPIIMGPTVDDCETSLPPDSFLHINNFTSLENLGAHLKMIMEDEEKLLFYHRWRNHLEVVNEHGFFGTRSMHLCRICEALQYNDVSRKVYDEHGLGLFLDPKLNCR